MSQSFLAVLYLPMRSTIALALAACVGGVLLLLFQIQLMYSMPINTPYRQHFVVYGDWGLLGMSNGTASRLNDTASALDRLLVESAAEFVLNVGDNFYHENWEPGMPNSGGVESIYDSQWTTKFINKFHVKDRIWYSALGNHDYMGNVQAQLDFAKAQIDPRFYMPHYFYTVQISSKFHIIVFDTNIAIEDYWNADDTGNVSCNTKCSKQFVGRSWEEQLVWAAEEIDKIREIGGCLFAMGHHHLAVVPELADFLIDKDINVYFNGHVHGLQHHQYVRNETEVLHHFTSATGAFGSFRSDPLFLERESHILGIPALGERLFDTSEAGFLDVELNNLGMVNMTFMNTSLDPLYHFHFQCKLL